MSKSKKQAVSPKAVPIQRTDLSTFDDSFSFLKEKFAAEMQRMEDEMLKFSANLMSLYGQQGSSNQPGQTSSDQTTWDALANSPLIQGDGTAKTLKLQFDMSAFDPAEVKVELLGDMLTVYAHHEQKSDNSIAMREIKRQFILPRGFDPEQVVSSISRDGVLTVQAPLPQLVPPLETSGKPTKETKVFSKNVQEVKPRKASIDKQPKPEIQATTPADVTGKVPQSPLSSISPASPQTLPPTSPTTPSPAVLSPQKTSKAPSKTPSSK